MSHFPVLVALPAGTADLDDALTKVLAPYDEGDENVEDAKWDWWVLGGRWTGYFPLRTSAVVSSGTVGRPGVFGDAAEEGTVDAGRKRDLDLDMMRDDAQATAEQEWDTYQRVVAGTPPATPWAEFLKAVKQSEAGAAKELGATRSELIRKAHREAAGELGVTLDKDAFPVRGTSEALEKLYNQRDSEIWGRYERQWTAALTYSIHQARRDYGRQLRVSTVRASEEYQKAFLYDPIDEIDPYTRDEYVARARAAAVPGFAAVLLDGSWVAAGEMGWFGMSSDDHSSQDVFRERMNAYLDDLDDDVFLAVVDCHI